MLVFSLYNNLEYSPISSFVYKFLYEIPIKFNTLLDIHYGTIISHKDPL